MKILIQSTNPGAHKFTNLGLGRAFQAMGHESFIWEDENQSAFDIFDSIKPDIFLGQTYNLNESIIKCIAENPIMKVGLRASDYSDFANEVAKKFPILVANDKEVALVEKLRDITGKPHFLHNHYTQHSIETTHSKWIERGFNVKSSLLAADLFDFHGGEYKQMYDSDITFCGGRWGYKSLTIDPYIVQLCQPQHNYKIKIFGNQGWGIPQYCGYAPDSEVKHILKSAKICLNVHEPHSQIYGYDIIERPYKLLANKCFCISDHVADLKFIIPNGIMYANNPKEYKVLVDYFLENPSEKEKYIDNGYKTVMRNHTYFDRAKEIFGYLNIQSVDINKIKEKFDENCNNWL